MFHDIEQNTDPWLEMRAGKVTGSSIAKVMANDGKAFGEPAKRLAVEIALEQIRGTPILSTYTNADMERGHEQEPLARARYEDEYFCTVDNGGFFDNIDTGCSPDGLVNHPNPVNNGVIEIKCVIPSVQYKRVKSGTYDSAYRWQLIFNLKETGRPWIDYISFCPEFTDNKQLFVTRMYAESQQTAFEKIDARLEKFLLMVKQIKAEISE